MILHDENHKQQFKYLGGPTALLKVQSTQTAEFVTSEACQIFVTCRIFS